MNNIPKLCSYLYGATKNLLLSGSSARDLDLPKNIVTQNYVSDNNSKTFATDTNLSNYRLSQIDTTAQQATTKSFEFIDGANKELKDTENLRYQISTTMDIFSQSDNTNHSFSHFSLSEAFKALEQFLDPNSKHTQNIRTYNDNNKVNAKLKTITPDQYSITTAMTDTKVNCDTSESDPTCFFGNGLISSEKDADTSEENKMLFKKVAGTLIKHHISHEDIKKVADTIKKRIDQGRCTDISLIILNILKLAGEWEIPFEKLDSPMEFRLNNGSYIKVPGFSCTKENALVYPKHEFTYEPFVEYESFVESANINENGIVVRLPTTNHNIKIDIVMLPKNTQDNEKVNKLIELLAGIDDMDKSTCVDLTIPNFNVDDKISITKEVNDVLLSSTTCIPLRDEFKCLETSGHLKVEATQQVLFQADHKGFTAEVETEVDCIPECAGESFSVDIKFDKPYYTIIRSTSEHNPEKAGKSILLMLEINNPDNQSIK